MRKVLLVFFFVLSIALISSPAFCQSDSDTSIDKGHKGEINLESSSAEHKTADWKDYNVHDPGVTQDETQLIKTPLVATPDDEIDLPDKYNTENPDIQTMVAKDTTPTCEEIFTIIAMKQEKGEELTWYDQSMRARCLEQPKPEDDDEPNEQRDELYSLDQPITDHQTEGQITKIKVEIGPCCPDVKIECPGCPEPGYANNRSYSSSNQSHGSQPGGQTASSSNNGSGSMTGSQANTGNTPGTKQTR